MAHSYDYDILVIGAGIAGFVSAVTANGVGKRVAVIERGKVGGNCTNYTCIPTKTFIRSSHFSRDWARAASLGFKGVDPEYPDAGGVLDRVRSVVQAAYEKDLPESFLEIGVEVLHGEASFVDRHRILVDGKVLTAEKFIIATGSRPFIPPIQGLETTDYLTTDTLFALERLPATIIVLGGGVAGLELASAFARLGVKTTVVEAGARIAPMVDLEIGRTLFKILQKAGICFVTQAKISHAAKDGDTSVLTYTDTGGNLQALRAARVLLTVGRLPNVEALNLKKIGVKTTPRGLVTNSSLRTGAENIFACGDIVGPWQLATTAESQGILAATNAVAPIHEKVDYRHNVMVIFTDPPISFIGLSEQRALKKYGANTLVYRFGYDDMRRAMIDAANEGFAKIICDGRGRVVGAHILGEAAPEVIHEIQIISYLKTPLHKLHAVTHAYPTYSQAVVGRAAQLAYLDKMGKSFFVRKGLELLPGYSNRLTTARDRLAETPVRTSRGTDFDKGEYILSRFPFDERVDMVTLPRFMMSHDERPLLELVHPERGFRRICINFERVERINPLGIGVLVKFTCAARGKAVQFTACGLTRAMKDILRLTTLHDVIDTERPHSAGLSDQAQGYGTHTTAEDVSDADHWAKVPWNGLLSTPDFPTEARNINVAGRRAVGPPEGFGQLWQKIYRLYIDDLDITPESAITALRENFIALQPSFNHFYASNKGIRPGEIVAIDSSTPGGPVSTGVMILHADERSFTFITPEGHPEAGWITFSAYRDSEDRTVVQILGLTRSSDPVFEAAFHLVGSKMQVNIWTFLLKSLAAHLGVASHLTVDQRCVDPRTQWGKVWNIWYNAQIRTLLWEPFFRFHRMVCKLL